MTAAGRLPAEDSVAPAVRSVFLLEDQPDHAELMLEALGNRLPGVHVCWSFGPECGHTDADVLVISLASDPALVRAVLAQRPALLARPAVVLSGAGDRWTPADLAGIREAARLDKRSGGEFLRALPEAVARVAVLWIFGKTPGS